MFYGWFKPQPYSPMLLTSDDFYNLFPELESLDSIAIEAMLTRVLISQNGYQGLHLVDQQKHAVLLHTAHLLVRTNLQDGSDLNSKQPFKTIENKNDKIEYQVSNFNLYDLESTPYGIELLSLLESNACGLFLHDPQASIPTQSSYFF